jgi:hypothetical protein
LKPRMSEQTWYNFRISRARDVIMNQQAFTIAILHEFITIWN